MLKGAERVQVLTGAGSAPLDPSAPAPSGTLRHLAAPFSTLLDTLIATVIAPVCACCEQPLDDTLHGAVCGRCWSAIPPPAFPICAICGDALPTWRTDVVDTRCSRCRRRRRVITRGRSIAVYEGRLRDILQRLKYDGRRSVAKALGERMAAAGADVLEGADALVPVPLHWRRRYSRGFNQAEALAVHVGLPVMRAIVRTRRTVTQTDLPEPQRRQNVSGAFAIRRRARVQGLTLVLVDDVSTTGATLDACAGVLLDAGAKDVRALTAARAAARLP